MKLTTKTYYGLCVVSSALATLQCVLFAFGYPAALLGSAASLLFGCALLFLAGGKHGMAQALPLAAAVLTVVGFMPGFGYIPAAFAWPCFAVNCYLQGKGAVRSMSSLVIIAGIVQLICGFLPLGRAIGGAVGAAITAVQLLFSLCLFKSAKANGGQD